MARRPDRDHDAAGRAIDAWLADKARATREAYAGDLADLARHLGVATVQDAAQALLAGGRAEALAIVRSYQRALADRAAAGTVNRRIASINSLTRTAQDLDLVDWRLTVAPVPATVLRDTRGPDPVIVARMFAIAKAAGGLAGRRDRAILALLYGEGLRRGEAGAMNRGDVDLRKGRPAVIRIQGKGRRDTQIVPINGSTRSALAAWLDMPAGLEDPADPLFVPLDNGHRHDRRLGPGGIARMVDRVSRAAGFRTTPHGLRHAAISAMIGRGALMPDVQKFSRHKDLRMLAVYYDQTIAVRVELGAAIMEGML